MKGLLLLALTASLTAQDSRPGPRDLLKNARPLRMDEIASILTGTRAAIAGRTVRLAVAPDGPGPDILFGADGRLRVVRTTGGIEGGLMSSDGTSMRWHTTTEAIADYTGKPARRCDGAAIDGELVVRYLNENDSGWKATARAEKRGVDAVAPALVMLSPLPGMESGGLKVFGERRARALVAPWTPPPGAIQRDAVIGDPRPNADPLLGATPPRGSQTLWIDVESLRPIRWSASVPGGRTDALTFTYDLSPEPQIPAGVTPPDCVP
jgi:hypothetical protein